MDKIATPPKIGKEQTFVGLKMCSQVLNYLEMEAAIRWFWNCHLNDLTFAFFFSFSLSLFIVRSFFRCFWWYTQFVNNYAVLHCAPDKVAHLTFPLDKYVHNNLPHQLATSQRDFFGCFFLLLLFFNISQRPVIGSAMLFRQFFLFSLFICFNIQRQFHPLEFNYCLPPFKCVCFKAEHEHFANEWIYFIMEAIQGKQNWIWTILKWKFVKWIYAIRVYP